jgi:hypothetical protein
MVAVATPDVGRATAGRKVVHAKDARPGRDSCLIPGAPDSETPVMNGPWVD